MARAQLAIEFIVMIGIAFVIGAIFLAVTVQLLYDTSEQQRVGALNDIGYSLQDEIILASSVQDGYLRVITVPPMADRFAYTISSTPTSIDLSSGEVTISYPIPAITGGITHAGQYNITKDGDIMVTG